MQIFVLRHGQAEPQKTTDELRNLTEKGRVDVAASVNFSIDDLLSVKEIWASSLVRAQQTAQIVQAILLLRGISVAIKTTDLITPESYPSGLFDSLQNAKVDSILLASHMPFVGGFLDISCGKAAGFYSMNTSSLALLECDVAAAGCCELRWLRNV